MGDVARLLGSTDNSKIGKTACFLGQAYDGEF